MLMIHSKGKPILVRFLWTEKNAGATYAEIGKRAYRVKLARAEPNRPEFLINPRGIADYSRRLAERIDGPRILPAARVGSVFGSAARFAYYPSWLRVNCERYPSILITSAVASYRQVNVALRQELARSGDSSCVCFPCARENRSD
jgi:hypothetical protein